MKDIPKAKLKTYLLMTFLFISIFGGVLEVLLSYSDWDEYIDTLNYEKVYADLNNYQISHTNNDAWETGTGVTDTTDDEDYVRTQDPIDHVDYKCSGFMFDSVDIPHGSTITEANVSVYIKSGTKDDIDAWLFGHDVDDSEDFVDDPDIMHTRTQTTATVNWVADDLGVGWEDSPDITDVIQEIVDRVGWESGNNLTILFIAEDETTFKWTEITDYSYNPPWSAILNVEWDPPEGGNEIYADSVDSSSGVTNATHTLDNNNTWAEIEYDGWIVWDFAGGTAYNITAIRWEITHSVSNPVFRLSGSHDKIYWVPICQTTRTHTSNPPLPDSNTSTRYDTLYYPNYRYYMFQAVSGVLSDWYIDYICLVPAPPYINYNISGYIYPTEVEYYNYRVSTISYIWKPFNMLGENQSSTTVSNHSVRNHLVNIDHDEDNWAVLKFVDYLNITSIGLYAKLGASYQHTYMYVSRYPDSDFTLVWDSIGLGQPTDWYNIATNQTYVRYIKINCTGIMSSYTEILTIRVEGILSGGAGGGPPPTPDEFSFILLPNYIGDLLGLGLAGGQFFASLIILSAFLLPIAVYDRKGIIALIVGVAVFGFLVLIGWLPEWIMLIMVLLVAGIFAFNFSRWFGGRGR